MYGSLEGQFALLLSFELDWWRAVLVIYHPAFEVANGLVAFDLFIFHSFRLGFSTLVVSVIVVFSVLIARRYSMLYIIFLR